MKKKISDGELERGSTRGLAQSEAPRERSMSLLVFNLVSTLLVINLNKYVFRQITFGYPAVLSNVHFLISWLGVSLVRRFNPSSSPPLPQNWIEVLREREFLVMCVLMGLVTPLNNQALKWNSTGFYQVAKTAVTPVVVLIEYLRDGTLPSPRRLLCLVAVCLCVVAMSRAGAVAFSKEGLTAVLLWIPLAAGYKVHFGRLRTKVFGPNASTLTLMSHLFPYAIIIQTLMIPFVDPPGFRDFVWTPKKATFIALSGVAAFLVNWSGFLVIGHLGGIAHILLGNAKAAGTTLIAAILFGERYSPQELLAALGALVAVAAYSLSPSDRSSRSINATR